jgi:hypothetical protein
MSTNASTAGGGGGRMRRCRLLFIARQAAKDACGGRPQPQGFGSMALAQCPDGPVHGYGIARCPNADGRCTSACRRRA